MKTSTDELNWNAVEWSNICLIFNEKQQQKLLLQQQQDDEREKQEGGNLFNVTWYHILLFFFVFSLDKLTLSSSSSFFFLNWAGISSLLRQTNYRTSVRQCLTWRWNESSFKMSKINMLIFNFSFFFLRYKTIAKRQIF